jgi:sugar/nucleoside kinase (ribokinase family)
VLLVDGHYMRACQAWAEGARARNIHVVLDGGSWKAGTRELLPHVDTAICSADFLPPGCTTEEDVLAFVRDCGVANVAITRGPEPVRFIAGATAGTMAVPHVQVVDTMGAGDILHGALCYYIASGLGFIRALERAIDVASLSTSFVGPREWMNRSGGA